jgi:hypothetical protein
MKRIRRDKVYTLALILQLGLAFPILAQTLPPSDDTPEEILRTQIYTEARSPVDGSLLTAKEYIELKEDLESAIADIPPEMRVSQKVQDLIALLKLRKFIRQIIPFF